MYNILIVDDSLFVVKQLSQIFSSQGWNIIATANTGAAGIKLYKEHYPDVHLVSMDITMPSMNGIDALKEIMRFDSHARVVMITGLGMEELVLRALQAGAKGYIMKPLNRTRVIERIEPLLYLDMGG